MKTFLLKQFNIYTAFLVLIYFQSCKQTVEPKQMIYNIFFVSETDLNYDIYSVHSDGTNLKNLTNNSAHDWKPICSKYSNQLYFNSRRDNYLEIYSMNFDGNNISNLSQNHLNDDYIYDISFDGSTLLFASARIDTGSYILDLDTKEVDFTGLRTTDAKLSPDGSQIVYIENNEIHLYNIDEKNDIILCSLNGDFGYIQYSPDGSKLIFENKSGFPSIQGGWEIWSINVDGSELKPLTNNVGTDTGARFSPDGSKITFTHFSALHDTVNVYIINMDGSNQTQITSSELRLGGPEFSHDGHVIACVSSSGDLYIMNNNGTNLRKITENLSIGQYIFQPK